MKRRLMGPVRMGAAVGVLVLWGSEPAVCEECEGQFTTYCEPCHQGDGGMWYFKQWTCVNGNLGQPSLKGGYLTETSCNNHRATGGDFCDYHMDPL